MAAAETLIRDKLAKSEKIQELSALRDSASELAKVRKGSRDTQPNYTALRARILKAFELNREGMENSTELLKMVFTDTRTSVLRCGHEHLTGTFTEWVKTQEQLLKTSKVISELPAWPIFLLTDCRTKLGEN